MRQYRRLLGAAALTLAASAAGAVPAAAQHAPPAQHEPELAAGKTPLTIQGFGDINYIVSAPDGQTTGFLNGAFDLFATSRLGDRWSALVELLFESYSGELEVDLERFQFTFEQSDALRISAGRMHSPVLRWPIAHHHGGFMQTPIDKPIVARWEDEPGLWPLHFVGVMAHGRAGGSVGVSYMAGIGNGRGRTREEVQVAEDANDHRAFVGSLGLRFAALPGFEISGSTYVDRIPAEGGELREHDVSVSTAYLFNGAEIRAEWSQLRHRDVATGRRFETRGWYVLAAHRLPGTLTRLKPYVLVEDLDAAEDELFLGGAQDEAAWAAGLRYDVNQWVALKSDYRSYRIADGDRLGTFRVQLAVNF